MLVEHRTLRSLQPLLVSLVPGMRQRNTNNAKADWHFTTADARIKLKSLYPAL